MSVVIKDFRIIANKRVSENIYQLIVCAPEISNSAKPGQFCNLLPKNEVFLRRPFSISDVENENVTFLYEIVGIGTEAISKLMVNQTISIEGPLGNGFFIDEQKVAILVAGGIGYAPFPFLIKALNTKNVNYKLYHGVRNSKFLIKDENPKEISSDDGSVGFRGNVLELIEKENNWEHDSIKVYSCGPTQMLKASKEYFEKLNIDTELSTESRMACGIGICQGCPVEKADSSGFLLVCKDGPVFNSKAIRFS